MSEPTDHATSRHYVLLGASNVTIAFPLLMRNLLGAAESPVDIHAALGHGRSFIGWSRVFWRGLPGIAESGLWDALKSVHTSTHHPPRALITDVGNDLLYGYPVEEIVATVSECVHRLREVRADIVMTLPPMAAVRKLSRWRFSLARRVMFPTCRLTLAEVLAAANSLEEQLAELGRANTLPVITPPADWYGFDPIHIRRNCRSSAWREILSRWPEVTGDSWQSQPSREWKRQFRKSRPANFQWRGRDIVEPQPTVKTCFGNLSLY